MTFLASLMLFYQGNPLSNEVLTRWITPHYAINYFEFGFVKRALIGTIYHLISATLTAKSLFLFQLFFIFITIAITHYFFARNALEKKFIYLLFILSPATFMQYGADFGRFDPILMLIFLLSILSRGSPFLFVFFSIIGILVHEIYIFSFLPASFLLMIEQHNRLSTFQGIIKRILTSKLFYILLGFILIIIYFGQYEGGSEQILKVFENSKLPKIMIQHILPNKPGQALAIWTNSIWDNLAFSSSQLILNPKIIYIICIYPVIFGYFHLLGVNFKKPMYYLVFLAHLPMFFLGVDWGRWITFFYVSIFMIFITTEKEKAAKASNKYMLLFSLYGPIGVLGMLSPLESKIYHFIKFIYAF